MKKFYGFYTILSTLMILLIAGNAGASFTGDGKGFYGNDPFIKASTTLRDREEVPEGLTKTEWGKISASIERDRYRLHKDDRTGAYQAPNHAHSLDATFTREGFEVSPRKGEKRWNWGLSLSRYGYGSDLHDVPVAEEMITKDNRIEYLRGDMVEWYINDHRGLEQGFTLKSRPSCRKGSGFLQLQMTTTTNLIPGVEKEGKGIIFRDAQGKEVLRYSGLYAYDAAGKDLFARMAANQEGIRLIVDDHEAVYPIIIDPFIERKKLLAGDGAEFDNFGHSVSISGDTAIVGACYDDDNGSDSGSAYIFSRDQGGAHNWGQVKKITAGDGAASDFFGYSVSISGDTAIVGAHYDDDNGRTSGSAYIFSRNQGEADNWGQVKKLTASDGAAYDNFGCSVSISGDTAIIGARWDDDNGSDSGSAYIFSRDQGGTDNWGQFKKLTDGDGAASDYFGISVSISGDTTIVGAHYDDDNGSDSGSAYIFSRDQGGTDNWGQVKKLTGGDGAADDWFGFSVSISGDTTIVGTYQDDDNGIDSGSAYIFSRDQGGADNWGQVKKLTASDGAASDNFGCSVSISGDTAIVGSHYDDDNGSDSGSAYIFSRDHGGAGNWGQVKKNLTGDGEAGDWFGDSVSISGDTAIIGARGDNDNGSYSGSAYIFSYVFGDELAVDFATNGLWHYSGTTWTHLAAWNPDGMAEWDGGLAVNFGASYGLWNYDATTWNQLAAWEPEDGIAWDSGLAIDFAGNGLWSYDGSSWTSLAGWDPDDGMVEWTGGLAVDFGATYGLWNYNGTTWTPLAAWNPDDMLNWTNGLAVDFGPNGLWSYDGSSWTSLAGWDPDGMVEWAGGLAVDFGATYGLWNYNGTTWTPLAAWNPDDMVNWTDGIAVDFGPNGLWSYDGSSWTSLASWNPEDMEAWGSGLIVDFGVTYGLWNYNGSSWSNLAGWDSEDIIDIDLY